MFGQTIQNRYKIVAELGSGGAGKVYKALDITLHRDVALKLLKPEKYKNQQVLQRFYREARKASQLSHPNTVTVYDFGRTDEGMFFLVMEYLRGLSLKKLLKNERFLGPARVVHLMGQVCDSLAEAHDLGIVHRDLKPDNIFLCAKGEQRDVVKLVDFGLAKTVGSQTDFITQEGTPGTPNYMAPEQIAQGEVDVSSDLYALGAVMYACLTGTPVFAGKRQMVQVLWSHMNEEPQPPTERAPERDIPPALETLVLRMLEKDPARRPKGAREVKAALLGIEGLGQWRDEDASQAWVGYDLDAQEAAAEEAARAARTVSTDEIKASPQKPVTFESTGMKPAFKEEEETPDTGEQGPVQWAMLIGVTIFVAAITVFAVIWFFG